MSDTIQLSQARLHLVLAPRDVRRKVMTDLTARLALKGAVRLVDGGNSFDAYGLARQLRGQSCAWRTALERVIVARAFTCYQMVALVAQMPSHPPPTLALDLLDTFYDENVPLPERRRLLAESLTHLWRISRFVPVAVSGCLPERGQPGDLLEMLAEAAGQVWSFPIAVPTPPLRLF